MAYPEEDGILYALYPGYVVSANDGDRHYIGPRQLANLYMVPMHQCVVIDDQRPFPRGYQGYMLPLRPQYDGNYSVARVIQQMTWD